MTIDGSPREGTLLAIEESLEDSMDVWTYGVTNVIRSKRRTTHQMIPIAENRKIQEAFPGV